MPENLHHQTYLGDGLYAGWDGWSIWIWTDRDEGRHYICLGPSELDGLAAYQHRLALLAEADADTHHRP